MEAWQQEKVWEFILRVTWISAAANIGVLVLAYARDFLKLYGPTSRTRIKSSVLPKVVRDYLQSYSTTRSYTPATVYDFLRVLANLTICVIYVVGTYKQDVGGVFLLINRIFAALFTVETVLMFFSTPSALLFVWSLRQMLSITSIPSLFMASGKNQFLHFGFLRAYEAFYSYVNIERRVVQNRADQKKKLFFRLGLQFLTLFFVLACGIMLLELPGDWLNDQFLAKWEALNDWNFFNCFYYVVVTLSTVGYGDYSPKTLQGRVFTILMIIVGILVFTNIVDELKNDSRRQRGIGTFRPAKDHRHVIVLGTPTLEEFQNFLRAYYEGDTSYVNKTAMIVLLLENPSFSDDEWFSEIASNSFMQDNIVYLVGSVKEASDLERAGIHSANAVFILASPIDEGGSEKFAPSNSTRLVQQADTQAVMTALAVRNVRTDIPIFAKTLLDDSNEQIDFAMKTPATGFADENMRFRPKLGPAGQYQSFHATVMAEEFSHLPRSIRRKRQMPPKTNLDAETVARIDAKRSKHVCMQQLYTALMVANMKSNGVGTLCTNLHVEFADEKANKDYSNHMETPWLVEYSMGSECSLLNGTIPKDLDGVPVRDVALLLYETGLILVGSRFQEPTEDLHGGPAHGIDKDKDMNIDIVDNLDLKLQAGKVCLFLTYLEMNHLGLALQKVARRYLEMKESGTPVTLCDKFKGEHELAQVDYGASGVIQYLSFAPNDSRGGERTTKNDEDGKSSWFDFDTAGRMLRDSPSIRDKIKKLKQRHIIIALEGRTPLDYLEYFLDLLNPKGEEPVPVVIMCAGPQESDRVKYESRQDVYILDGKPSSRESWDEARLSNARAVAILTDYTQRRSADASTIYTLLTLDSVTDPGQNIFICSELMDEQSIELLRQPKHRRRFGVPLGQPNGQAVLRNLTAENDSPTPTSETTGTSADTSESSDSGQESASESTPSEQQFRVPKKQAPQPDFIPLIIGQSDPKRISNTARDDLFSRYRYTSGELLVHSTADSLLVREYAEPGFIDFIRKLVGAFGTTSENPHDARVARGQFIRLVRIPSSLFAEYRNTNALQYGIVVERLFALGVVPIGLYRSGAAEVRYPAHKRASRGLAIYEESALRNARSFCMPGGGAGFESALPTQQLHQQGRHDLTGDTASPKRTRSPWYKCFASNPSTKIDDWETADAAHNMLPYVFTFPEYYTAVHQLDAVYVLCQPSVILPENWPRPALVRDGD